MKITVISTSPRKSSGSLVVAKAIAKQLDAMGQQEVILDNFEDYDIPMVGQGSVKVDDLTIFQSRLIKNWEKGQLIIFTIPEYNWFTSGQLINAIHQLGNDTFAPKVFNDKVFAFVGVSVGRGGRMPAIEMTTLVNKMISFTNQQAVVSPKIFESHDTRKNLDEDGNFIGVEVYQKTMTDFLDYSVKITERWFR